MAVDAVGVNKVIDANKIAKSKNLAVAVGLQRHHEPIYIETIKRLQDGEIGRILATRGVIGTAKASGFALARMASQRWSTRCGTGITSTGCVVTILRNSIFTIWTLSTG